MPSFFLSAPAMAPRTVYGCHSRAATTSSMVLLGSTQHCNEVARPTAEPFETGFAKVCNHAHERDYSRLLKSEIRPVLCFTSLHPK